MKGRERNSAFFQKSKEDVESTSGSGGLLRLYKTARETGKLNLSGRALSLIPDTVFTLATTLDEGDKFWEVNPLTRLDLSSNVLKDIPNGKFDQIKGDLTYLNLKDNKLKSVPGDLFACNQLKYLNLSLNELENVTDSIGELVDLKELFLSNNKLATVPISVAQCKELQTIELQNNILTRIPLESLNLPQLLKLNLSSNKLTEIPVSISRLISLGQHLFLLVLRLCSFINFLLCLSRLSFCD